MSDVDLSKQNTKWFLFLYAALASVLGFMNTRIMVVTFVVLSLFALLARRLGFAGGPADIVGIVTLASLVWVIIWRLGF